MQINKEQIKTKSIKSILDSYRVGSLTTVDAARAWIDLYKDYEAEFMCWTCYDTELFLKQAELAGQEYRKGGALPLAGIPVGVKDIFNTEDFPTEMGSPIWQGFRPGNDARVVFNLKRAGAIIPGKTVTAEFAVHALGKTLNPHDKARNPGTSSSGSAVAVALGMVPAALATQTAGSIIRPASFSGVYGYRPSFGTIPRTGMLKTTDSLDSVGFFVRFAEDLELVYDALRVHGQDYPVLNKAFTDPNNLRKPSSRPWKIGVCRTHLWASYDDVVKNAFDEYVEKISKLHGTEVVSIDLPSLFEEAHHIHATIYNRSLAHYFANEYSKPEFVSPIMQELISDGEKIALQDFQAALERQGAIAQLANHLFDEADVILTPSTAGVAPLRDVPERNDSALIWTLAYLPVIGAPVFSDGKLPFGLQIVGKRFTDYKMFEFVDFLRLHGALPEAVFEPRQ